MADTLTFFASANNNNGGYVRTEDDADQTLALGALSGGVANDSIIIRGNNTPADGYRAIEMKHPVTMDMRLNVSGAITLGDDLSMTGDLNVTGAGEFSGSVTAASFDTSSDSRLKKEVVDIEGALDSVKAMRGVRYNWVDPEKPQREVGVIAQEVQAQYPEMVRERENGFLVVDYTRLTAVLIQAVKELEARVAALEQ
jgi:hypothetical protein